MKEVENSTPAEPSQAWGNRNFTKPESGNFDKVKAAVGNKLHSAAETLREKSDDLYEKNKEVAILGNQTADWLTRSADYIEGINPQKLKGDVENQVRRNPGRSLLIAAGVGLVLGSLFRRR